MEKQNQNPKPLSRKDAFFGLHFDLHPSKNDTQLGEHLTEEMIARAEENLEMVGATNVEIIHVDTEEFPFSDDMFDVVISNGVINLSPCKQDLFKEIYRVLKPGGRLQFADIVAEKEIPSSLTGSLEAWSQ